MARIRTVKPEFWEDDTIGTLSRDARLLFIAAFNIADDEGLLRWTPAFIKAKAFLYDDDVTVDDVQGLMAELAGADLVYPYRGGQTQQLLAFIVKFRKHQKINRPQPSKLPAPSLQNPATRAMYGRRDDWTCHLCGESINNPPKVIDHMNLSIDHLVPRSAGGSDYPSNLRASHQTCNKRRHTRPLDVSDVTGAVPTSGPHSLSDTVNGSDDVDEPGRDGREGEGEGNGREGERASANPLPPSPRCQRHVDNPTTAPCGGCKDARIAREAWDKGAAERGRDAMLSIRRCQHCDAEGQRYQAGTRHPMTPYRKCDHRPLRSVG